MKEQKQHKKGGLMEMLVIALPIVISQSCETLMVFTDRFFLSKLGAVQMNATMAGGLSSFMMMCFFTGVIGYSTALIGQYLGAGRMHMCSKTTSQAFLFALVSYPLILLLKPLAYLLFDFMELSEEQMVYQRVYFDILVYGSIITLIRSVFSSYFSGIGRTRIIMTSTIVAMVVNIGINYVIIFGRLGFPALGIEGAAYGTLAGGLVGVLMLVWAYFKEENRLDFSIAESFAFVPKIFKKLFHYGYPPGVELLLNIIAFNSLILIFQAHNPISAVAATITFSWDMVSFVPLIGIEVAVTSLVGRYMGAERSDIAEKSAYSGLKIGLAFSAIIFVLFIAFPGMLVDVFKPDGYDATFQEARSLSIFMIQLAAIYVTIEAAIVTFIGVLRGAGDTLFAMLLSTSMHWAMAIAVYFTLSYYDGSAKLAWGIAVGAFFLMGIAFYLRFKSGKWKELEIIDHND